MRIIDLGTLNYTDAWREQERVHAEVLAGAEEAILLVEHTPVITFGRRAEDSAKHLVASRDALKQLNVDLVESDRGGDITFHGPGQLVAYPIVRLADHRLSVGAYVKALEHAVMQTLAHFGIDSFLDPGAIGVWVDMSQKRRATSDETPLDSSLVAPRSSHPAKVCALGVRIKRGVSMHGIALNITTDLSWFNLIVPCGITGKAVTSLDKIMGDRVPSMDEVKRILVSRIAACVNEGIRNNAQP
jgi:lipoyl(octanoyl) transferase